MDLIINGTAVAQSSLGARRYYEAVRANLDWPGKIEINSTPPDARLVRILEMLDRGRRDAIYWSPCHRGPLFAHNHVVTVLDCINIEHVYRDDWRLPLLRTVFGRLLENARAVVCISNSTRTAVLRNFSVNPDKVLVFPGPIDVSVTAPQQESEVAQDRPDDFVLMISNTLAHKNTRRAVESFAASTATRRGIVLRVVGSIDPAALATLSGLDVVIEQHRNVPDTILRQWLLTCRFLWSPSLDEGLNLPIAEALSLGSDVLCSDIPVHREFYDGEASFFDPTRQQAMVEALELAFERSAGWHSRSLRPRPSAKDVGHAYSKLFSEIGATLQG
ncbi:hypothetical protein GCM10011529_15150 [Polymorphobacter glacialis]|uniref:Glycosyltransferase subfamily 4-like N-terminal domain-containing protein n=1 Tax=Sandarakinorhabdus glacialis TaxID=1614636 RepID=A0A916ZRR5_9SPHN|nr:glycosyltransferase [Polymorphobacter glacialis]GGE09773.1 hypothetical protein GCM10011529_15150 [Polymorphobacter glacialis]